MSETVRINFDPPRRCESHKSSWKLTAEGEPAVYVPQSSTVLEYGVEACTVAAILVPRFIAEDRGLVDSISMKDDNNDSPEVMSRLDWYILGCTVAMVASGSENPVWDGVNMAFDLMGELDRQREIRA